MIQDPNERISMIGIDGRVRSVPLYLKKKLIGEGFRVIVNPKEEWYPQYDSRNNQESQNWNVVENIDTNDYLEVEKL